MWCHLNPGVIICSRPKVSNVSTVGWIWPMELLYPVHGATGRLHEVGEVAGGEWPPGNGPSAANQQQRGLPSHCLATCPSLLPWPQLLSPATLPPHAGAAAASCPTPCTGRSSFRSATEHSGGTKVVPCSLCKSQSCHHCVPWAGSNPQGAPQSGSTNSKGEFDTSTLGL